MLYIIIPQAKISQHRQLYPKSNGYNISCSSLVDYLVNDITLCRLLLMHGPIVQYLALSHMHAN